MMVDHFISDVTDAGAVFTLDDGATWLVDDVDQVDSGLGIPMEDVLACVNDSLINIDCDGEQV